MNTNVKLIEVKEENLAELGLYLAEKRLLKEKTSTYSVQENISNRIIRKIENGQNVHLEKFLKYCEEFDVKIFVVF